MDTVVKAAALGLVGAAAALVIKKQNKELALLLAVAVSAAILLVALDIVTVLIDLGELMAEMSGLNRELLTPVLKTIGISIVASLSAEVCRDAGEGSIAAFVELCGSVASVYVTVPLIRAVLEMVEDML